MTDTSGTPPPEHGKPSSRLSRRGFVVGGLALAGLAGIAGARWFNVAATTTEADLTAPEALRAATSGQITLIDIRRPDEWARTGVGQGAVPIDMRSETFLEMLLENTQGRKDMPVALICARGVRSAGLSRELRAAGFSQVVNVPEGMLGSGAGPGWIKRGLPVVQF